ncbi:pentapeptide repeat-containing protein [Streptomyces chartreusis]|uniref:pentapeptide repeat-containing protein n=1 Tax=Streptomyces chartreusis TaxID=1969 RepID=UPI00366239AE
MRDQTTQLPIIGRARFDGAVFDGEADFAEATFTGRAEFDGVVFHDYARFKRTCFAEQAQFRGARFMGEVSFEDSRFDEGVSFVNANLDGVSRFKGVEFCNRVSFGVVQFGGEADFRQTKFDRAEFRGSQFKAGADLTGSAFASTPVLGPLICAGAVDLSEAVFQAPVTLELAAAEVRCRRTRWESTSELRLRYATVDLRDAVLSAPTAVTAHAAPFIFLSRAMDETALRHHQPSVRVLSVQGVDAAHLVLTDTDLSNCEFTGAFHLDQIRIEGRTTFAPVPKGLHLRSHIWPVRSSKRRTLAEEHHWRAQTERRTTALWPRTPARSWQAGPNHGDLAMTPDPEDVAALYRQLRKAFEDSKNEPGAADFYYGEMEMRRHSRTETSPGERGLLHAYWLLSGYGLRASRAFTWLALLMLTTILLMMGLGLPQHSPKQEASGIVPAGGGRITYTIDKEDPQNPTTNWFTTKRFEKALNVTLNSVVFRSSGQDLTTWGTYVEMASRLFEPALLALGVLAIRGRIKR